MFYSLGVEGYTKNDEVFLPVKRYTKIATKDFPERFAVVSRLKKESFSIGPAGDSIKSSVLSQVKLSVPEGAVSNDIQLTMQVCTICSKNTLPSPEAYLS